MSEAHEDNLKARSAWNTNAEFWDGRMGEGNDFFNVLVWPAVERLLRPEANAWILDIACGNGVTSRRLAHAGASVVAIDFAEKLIELAKARSPGRAIEYQVVDATDGQALLSLGETRFHGALCNMALMDIADLHPLMRALAKLLRPGGAFVLSVLHPCFNNPAAVQVGELEGREGIFTMSYSVKISRYMTPYARVGAAMHGQPVPHPYFHRPLGALVGPGFDAGFVLDARLPSRVFGRHYRALVERPLQRDSTRAHCAHETRFRITPG